MHAREDITSPEKEQYKILKSFLSGGFAGALNKTFIAPVERIKYLYVVVLLLCRPVNNSLPIAGSPLTSRISSKEMASATCGEETP